MGIEKYIEFVKRYQPGAVSDAARRQKTAFVTAAHAKEAVVMDAMTHLFTLTASVGWKNAKGFVSGSDLVAAYFKGISDYFMACANDIGNQVTKTKDVEMKTEGDERKTEDVEELETKTEVGEGSLSASVSVSLQRQVPCVVLVFDKTRYVNPGKRVEQARRALSRASVDAKRPPYDEGVEFSLAGVRTRPNEPPESIDVDRALRARGQARVKLRRFLISALEVSPPLLKWPPNTRLYVDSEEGVALYRSNERGELYSSDHEIDLSEFVNKLGEADVAGARWVRKLYVNHGFRRFRLVTVDTDWPVVHTYRWWTRVLDPEQPEKVHLIWDNTKNVVGLDLVQLIRTLTSLKFSKKLMVAVAVLSGCDYFNKGLATAYIGQPTLYNGAAAMADREPPERVTMERGPSDLQRLLNYIYAAHFKVDPDDHHALRSKSKSLALSGKRGVKMLLQSKDLFEAYVPFQLAMDYFCDAVCWDPDKDDPTKSAIERIKLMQLR